MDQFGKLAAIIIVGCFAVVLGVSVLCFAVAPVVAGMNLMAD
jgi:hypothetical protein